VPLGCPEGYSGGGARRRVTDDPPPKVRLIVDPAPAAIGSWYEAATRDRHGTWLSEPHDFRSIGTVASARVVAVASDY
jgi:hypothetical protein